MTWVTQLSSDRLDAFLFLLTRWKGPITIVVYTDELQDDLETFRPLQKKNLIDAHYTPASQAYYPVNLLRNVAMDKARTDFILFADVDFLPNTDAYDLIKARIPIWKTQDLKYLRVLPAFQMNHTCVGVTIPETKKQLKEMGNCIHQVHNDPGR